MCATVVVDGTRFDLFFHVNIAIYLNLYLVSRTRKKCGKFYLNADSMGELCQRDIHLSKQTIYWKIFYVNAHLGRQVCR